MIYSLYGTENIGFEKILCEEIKKSTRMVAMEYPQDTPSSVREVEASPYASALSEGLRDFGYDLKTALADIIDNSITAAASEVKLVAMTAAKSPFIVVSDNGAGMTESELIEAMRFGSKHPLNHRDSDDLGRFGLGLKSASFSQCRRLTVITRKEGNISCARWDLDRIHQHNNWLLIMIEHPKTVNGYEFLPSTGTVVVWEKLDRLTAGINDNPAKRTELINAELTSAEYHLRLVFHRFLEGNSPALSIYLNSRRLEPLDPFASNHPSTQRDPEEVLHLSKGTVCFRCYTLPHHKKMTKDEWKEIGGHEGHLQSQGLYIYRENRLIIAGGWLGLVKQAELTKLCRIAVDIPNTMDAEWKIDVKKASARLPPSVRERLKKIVERLTETSKRTYRSRGQRLVDVDRHPLWNRTFVAGEVSFRPNLEHPVIETYAEQLPDQLKAGFYRCIRLVGSTLPIDSLHAELVGNEDAVVSDNVEEADLEEYVRSVASALMENGENQQALFHMMQNYPFLRANWETVSRILDDMLRKNT